MSDKRRTCKTTNCDRLIVYRNGIPVSKWCPNCTYKRQYKNSSIERAHKKVKDPKLRTPMQRAIDRADEWFSRYVRIKNVIVSGNSVVVECYTCKGFFHIKKLDAGHFINRDYFPVRWNIENAKPQCTHCNCYREGKKLKFEDRLISEIGQNGVNDLKERAKGIANFSEKEIRGIAKSYRISVRLKEKELGIKVWK